MSPVIAVIGRPTSYSGHPSYADDVDLQHFDDRWVVVLNTEESGSYVLTGCVTVVNRDSDPQPASVKLVRRVWAAPFLNPPAEVLFDVSPSYQLPGESSTQFYVQAAIRQEGEHEMYSIDCNTYKGTAKKVSLIALKVDRLYF